MNYILHCIDLLGTFVFALSGATLGVKKQFDILGIFVIAMVTAIGGGVIRDICISATPPAGLVSGEYLVAVMLAVVCVCFFQTIILSFNRSSLFFDAVGLGFFSSFGANKVFQATGNVQLAVLLGCVSAVGGGCMRDVLAGDTPVIFRQEIYASAALIGAGIEVCGAAGMMAQQYSIWLSIAICMLIRLLSLHYGIKLPRVTYHQ